MTWAKCLNYAVTCEPLQLWTANASSSAKKGTYPVNNSRNILYEKSQDQIFGDMLFISGIFVGIQLFYEKLS